MNWTEGSLARHSRGRQRNALIARQKQHFAKARGNLLNGRARQFPVSISFLPSALDPSQRGALSRERHNRYFSPLLSVKREPKREHSTYPRDDDHITSSTNFDKRRRLLEKSDWAGLRLQKPLDISFPGQVYATKRWAGTARPPERMPNHRKEYVAAHGEERLRHLQRPPMRIQIGSQEIQPSITTRSQPSIKRYTTYPEPSAHLSRHNSTSQTSYCTRSTFGRDQALPTSSGSSQTPVNVVYSSSIIHEPAPRRDISLPILQWAPPSSETHRSMEVKIEDPTRPVPSLQESEQQKWKDWVLCESSLNSPSNSPVETTVNTAENRSSNSESSIPLPSHLQLRLPSLHLSSEVNELVQYSSPRHIDSEETVGSRGLFIDAQPSFSGHKSRTSNQRCTPQGKPDVPNDLNDIWMKFAYGDDNSEELLLDVFKEAAHQAAVELRPSIRSVSVDEPVETVATCGTEQSPVVYERTNDVVSSRSSSESHIATQGTTVSEPALSNAATVGSSNEPSRNVTRFVMPKSFVGKHINEYQDAIARDFMANAPTDGRKNRGKGGKKKKKKMAIDGRTDIRSLPDFDGDPIEEIEDD